MRTIDEVDEEDGGRGRWMRRMKAADEEAVGDG